MSSTTTPPTIFTNLAQLYHYTGGAGSAWDTVLTYVQYIEWAALVISVLLLIAMICFKLLAAEYEHKIHHRRHEEEIEARQGKLKEENPRWQQIEHLVSSPQEGDWRRAIIEADAILGELLTQHGFAGADIGEQLKGANQTRLASLDIAWEAHKVRNRIAHDGERYLLTQRDALATIDLYRRVFEELHFI